MRDHYVNQVRKRQFRDKGENRQTIRHTGVWEESYLENLSLDDRDIAKREEWIMDLNQLDKLHTEDLKQKCRMRWAIEGDENSKFFHALLKCKYANFNIKGVNVNGVWHDDPDEIKQAVIASCLSSPSISILINGSPSKEFNLERGLRQGDPLSPFLFLMVAEALQISILEACDKGLYKGVYLSNNGANISLLLYADDALFFRFWSRLNALHLIHILKCFELASGLKVNMSKIRLIGVGVSISKVDSLTASLGCTSDSIPFIYLGLPVGKGTRYVDGWTEVVNRVRERLSSWKANNLSIDGRLTLLKSVLGFKDSHRGVNWIKWDSILTDVKQGGLGVGSLLAKNLSLLRKWKWRFHTKKEALWFRVIIVKEIESLNPAFKSSFVIKVKNGSSTLFWKDQWCGTGIQLLDLFPRLYALDTTKDCKVIDRWGLVNGVWAETWSWRVQPRGRTSNDISALTSLIGNLQLCSTDSDKWSWSGDSSCSFKVRTLTKRLENILLNDSMLGEHHI
ncbi:RNA-directed DNA polymerase, eukaryota, reverse transcriptase zinc-binding domain protein [Tanacetum coccineum]